MNERPRPAGGVFWLLLVLAAALRFYQLGAESYWVDEVLSLRHAPSSVAAGFAQYWSFEGGGRPLGLIPFTIALKFGDSEFLTRLPSALFSVLDVAVVFFAARILRGVATAHVAMALLALSPLHVWYAQEARWYALWCLATSLSFLALALAWKRGRPADWVAYFAATVAGLYTFLLAVFAVASQVLAAWWLAAFERGRRFAIRQHLVVGVALLVALPTLAIALGLGPGGDGGAHVVGTPRGRTLLELPYTFFAYAAGYTLGPTVAELHRVRDVGWILDTFPGILAVATVVGVLCLAAVRPLRADRVAAAFLICWGLVLPIAVFAASFAAGQTFNVRYAFPGLPGFVILLAVGVRSFARPRARLVAGAAVVALSSWSLAAYYWNPRYDKEHVREAVALISGSSHASAPVGFVGQGSHVVRHYGPELDVLDPLTCSGAVPERAPVELPESPTFWLVVSRDWPDEAAGCLAEIRREYREVSYDSLPGVEVWRFERPGR